MATCPPLNSAQPLVCDPNSPYLQDFCTTVCRGNNDVCCISNCANSLCQAESANGAGSITGYIWGIMKSLYRINASGLQSIPQALKGKPRNMVFITGILIFIPMWVLFTVMLLILASVRTISWALFFLGMIVAFVIVALFALILFVYLEHEVTALEKEVATVLEPYTKPDLGTKLLEQFACVPAPGGYPC